MSSAETSEIESYYARGAEIDRLSVDPIGVLEFERSKEIILRHLPPAPAVVADIGGGPGRYAHWLAGLGYEVEHRDLMPIHVEQLLASLDGDAPVRTRVRDARDLDLGDATADAVLLLGPLYHLKHRADRLGALREARRVVRPGGPVFVAAISRWAPRLDGVLMKRNDLLYPDIMPELAESERSGRGEPVFPGAFTAYYHRPGQLRQEVRAAGLEVADLVGVEGAPFLLSDLADRMADPAGRQVVFETARATERVPELLGLGPHLMATGIRRA